MGDVFKSIGNAHGGNHDSYRNMMRDDTRSQKDGLFSYSVRQERFSERLRDMLEQGKPPSKEVLRRSDRVDVELVGGCIRYFAIMGDITNAKSFSDSSGISLKWAEESDVVAIGYAKIANSAVLFVDRGVGIRSKEITNLKVMRDLTGVKIPDSMHKALLDRIAEASYSSDRVLGFLSRYLEAVDLAIPQACIDKLYARMAYTKSSVDDLERAFRVYEITSVKPSDESILSGLRECLAHVVKLDDFPKYLPLFVDTKNVDEVRDFAENRSLPVHGITAIKMSFGIPVSEEEMEAAYKHVSEYSAAIKITDEDKLSKRVFRHGEKVYPRLWLKRRLDETIECVEGTIGGTVFPEGWELRRNMLIELMNISRLGLADPEKIKAIQSRIWYDFTSSGLLSTENYKEWLALVKEVKSSIEADIT